MPILDLEGVGLYYEERGSGEPVLFSHGIPTDYRAWGAQVDALSSGYRTITYSRRYAHPNVRAGDVADSTVTNNAEDLRALIEKLALPPVHLVGHSYGGFVAASLAVDHPELIRSLTMVEPAISTLLVEDETSSGQLLSLLLRSPSVALSARRFQNRSLKPSLAALDAGNVQRAVELNVDGVQDQQGALMAMPETFRTMALDNAKTIAELRTKFPSFKDRAPKMRCSTLVINGSSSPLWLRRIGELAAAAIPDCKAAKISSARHFPHVENRAEFNQNLRSFISTSAKTC